MINVNQGQTHYYTNKSQQDTINLRPGPGETLVLHGNIDPPPLVELEFPIEGDIVLSDTLYQITDIEEIPQTDGYAWGWFGSIVKFNKADNSGETPSRYKFIVSSPARNSDTQIFNGGFRVFDTSNELAHTYSADEYYTLDDGFSGCTIDIIRNCDIHGYDSRVLISMNFNAYYLNVFGSPRYYKTFNTLISYNKPINTDTILTEHQGGAGFANPHKNNQGTSVFKKIMIQWGNTGLYYGGDGERRGGVYRRPTGTEVHLPDEGSEEMIYLSSLERIFNKFVLHSDNNPSNDIVMGCGTEGGNIIMYHFDPNVPTGILATEGFSHPGRDFSTGHIACWMGSEHKYFVIAQNPPGADGTIHVYNYDFSLKLQYTIPGTTMWGIAIEENKIVTLSTQGLTLYTIEDSELVEHFNKPFDSTWISNYQVFVQPVYGNSIRKWSDFPVDIFKNEILVGSPAVDKVFLLKIGTGGGGGGTIMTQRMYLHSDHAAGITIDSNKLIIKTNSAHLSIPNNGEILTFNNPSGKAGRVDVNGLVTNYRTNSDYRIKYGVTPMSNTNYLNKINLLDPKYFKIKCKKCLNSQLDSNCECDNVVHEGFIAHELEEIFPNAVNGKKDQVDYQSIDTNFMIAGIVSAVKELDSTIENAMERTGYLEDFLG